MRGTVRAFWIGVAVSSAVFVFTGATTVDLDATAADPHAIVVTGRVDQGSLGRLLSTDSVVLGRVRATKRNWVIMTTYTEQIAVLGAQVANAAGAPLDLRVNLEMPGTVSASNSNLREGRRLVWTTLPPDGLLWAESRAVNWLVATLLAAAIALTLWMRGE